MNFPEAPGRLCVPPSQISGIWNFSAALWMLRRAGSKARSAWLSPTQQQLRSFWEMGVLGLGEGEREGERGRDGGGGCPGLAP